MTGIVLIERIDSDGDWLADAAIPGAVIDMLAWGHDDGDHGDELERHRGQIRYLLRREGLILDEDGATDDGIPVVPIQWCEHCGEGVARTVDVDGEGWCRTCADTIPAPAPREVA